MCEYKVTLQEALIIGYRCLFEYISLLCFSLSLSFSLFHIVIFLSFILVKFLSDIHTQWLVKCFAEVDSAGFLCILEHSEPQCAVWRGEGEEEDASHTNWTSANISKKQHSKPSLSCCVRVKNDETIKVLNLLPCVYVCQSGQLHCFSLACVVKLMTMKKTLTCGDLEPACSSVSHRGTEEGEDTYNYIIQK